MANLEKNPLNSKTEKNTDYPRRYKLMAGISLATAGLLSACGSSPEQDPAPAATVEVVPDQEETKSPSGEHETSSPSPEVSEEAKPLNENEIFEARIDDFENFKSSERRDLTYTVAGEKVQGYEALKQSARLDKATYPADTKESREELARAFMKNYQDLFINGGLTAEELDKFGYGTGSDDNPNMLTVQPYGGSDPNDVAEGLDAVRNVTYKEAFLFGSTQLSAYDDGPLADNKYFKILQERSQEQYERFQETGELAHLEVLEGGVYEDYAGEDGMVLGVVFYDHVGEEASAGGLKLAIQESTIDPDTWVVNQINEFDVSGYGHKPAGQ